MKRTIPKKLILLLTTALFVVGGITAPCMATSERMVGETGYAVQDTTMETVSDRNYSGGMDMVYAQIATGTAAAKTRCFLKAEDTLDWSTYYGTTRVMLYDYTGTLVQQIAEVDPSSGSYSGTAKLNPAGDTIWFSFTGDDGVNDPYYTVSADFDTMTFGTPTFQFYLPGSWEVEWPSAGANAGTPFFVGKENSAWSDPHAIFIRNSGAWQMVVNIGGYSNGIAFDNAGNLWCGSYTSSGPADQQYVYMFTADQVASAISSGTALTTTQADQTIALPTFVDDSDPENPVEYFTGPNDIECDSAGNVYITINGGFDEENNTEAGYVVMLSNNGSTIPSSNYYDVNDLVYLAQSDPTQDWDWQKALAYDGESYIDDTADNGYTDPTQSTPTANRLYVDQDYGWGSGGPDIVTAVTRDADYDEDGVPDAVDNAPETENPDQIDADQDGYGNMADADFDNDGTVGLTDYNELVSNWFGNDPVIDMDSDGTVGLTDYNNFRSRFFDTAPFK